jgi:hypothetical protein
MKSSWLRFGLMMFVFLPAGCGGSSPSVRESSSTPHSSASNPLAENSANVAFRLTVEQLGQEALTDKTAAEKKYKGKYVEVEGPVEGLVYVPTFDRYEAVSLKGQGPMHVQCMHLEGKSAEQAANLTKGQKVKIRGTFDGVADYLITLVNGELVEVGTDPAIAVSAGQLTKEYSADENGSNKKFKDKQLVLDGMIASIDTEKMSLFLEGIDPSAAKGLRIRAYLPNNFKRTVAGLTRGQTIKVKGECRGKADGFGRPSEFVEISCYAILK